MGDVYWLEQSADDVRPDDVWLTNYERCVLNTMRFQASRRLALRTLDREARGAACLESCRPPPQLAGIEIRAANPPAHRSRTSARPVPHCRFRSAIVKERRSVLVARSGVRLGCDLESIEPRSAAFIADYFTSGRASFVRSRLWKNAPHRYLALERQRERAEGAS